MSETTQTTQLFLRQVPAGPMGNCLYILADGQQRSAYLVDPAWDPVGLLEMARAEGFTVDGVLLTHTHQDHVGGEIFGQHIPGIAELLEVAELPLHVHEAEAQRLVEITGAPEGLVRRYRDGDRLAVGSLEMEVLHTPGHSPGSSCFLGYGELIAGDTLFVQGCGRVDLPGSDPDAMFHSLQRLAALAPETRVYPGHNYGPTPSSSIGAELQQNMYLRIPDLDRWRFLMSGG